MNQKFNIISIILMALLVILLFFVMINYYFKADTTSSESPLNMSGTDVIITSGDSEAIMSNYVGETESGEKTPIISNSGEEENSGDGVIDVIYNEEKNPESVIKIPEKDEQVIITSNENISDKEKKEVLQELDQTLMDLLDIVDKVQIVDESRLEEGIEVQP